MERGRRPLVARLRVGQVEELVLRELRMREHFEQAALTDRPDLGRPGDCLRVERALANHPQPSWLLGDEHVAVRQKREAPRILEPLDDRHRAHLRTDGVDFAGGVREGQRGEARKSSGRRRATPSSRRCAGPASGGLGRGLRGESDSRGDHQRGGGTCQASVGLQHAPNLARGRDPRGAAVQRPQTRGIQALPAAVGHYAGPVNLTGGQEIRRKPKFISPDLLIACDRGRCERPRSLVQAAGCL